MQFRELILIAIGFSPVIIILVMGIIWEIQDYRENKRKKLIRKKGYLPIE